MTLLKRKRSESELSFSSSSTFNSPPRPELFLANMMDFTAPRPLSFSRSTTPSHLNSRTMKRFRDSRPSEDEVHQRTLNLLYSAQKNGIQQQHHQQQQPQPVLPNHTHQQHHNVQPSLHSFWNLPRSTSSSSTSSHTASLGPVDISMYNTPASCEDCGETLGGLAHSNAMDVDGFAAEGEISCSACGKHVCSHCSITNLGEQRRCLMCAGRKGRVGGVGWAGVGVSA